VALLQFRHISHRNQNGGGIMAMTATWRAKYRFARARASWRRLSSAQNKRRRQAQTYRCAHIALRAQGRQRRE